MYNPSYYYNAAGNDLFEVHVCMNRSGLRGIAHLPFNHSVPKFQTAPREDYSWDTRVDWLAPDQGVKHGALVLANEAELRMEGDAMGNCVASYAARCSRGECRILSIRKSRNSKPVANVMIVPTSDGQWKVTQVLARRNTRPSKHATAAAHWAASQYGAVQAKDVVPDDADKRARTSLSKGSPPATGT